jgi:hypothetical protein
MIFAVDAGGDRRCSMDEIEDSLFITSWDRRRAKVLIAAFVALLLIPVAGAMFWTLECELWVRVTDRAAHAWVQGTDWEVSEVKQAGSDIVITVLGQGDTPPLEAPRENVRWDVPNSVDVLVIEASGRTTTL